MENNVIYRVLVKYIDKIGRTRRYSKDFFSEAYARKYYQDKYDSCCRSSEFYLYRICKKSSTTYYDILRESFVG